MTTDATDSPDDRPWPPGWLSALGVLVVVGQLAAWVPHYLTWPLWADHDVFASAAQSWDAGRPLYREVRLNQTPGTVYLFWVLGRTVGWGQPAWFYGVDAALVIGLVVALLAWSRAQFGRIGPGVVGALVLTGTMLGLDYAHAGQRDCQAPMLAALALLALQGLSGRRSGFWSGVGLVLSATLAALALAIRPQTVLLVPSLVASAGWLDPERPWGASLRRSAAWLALLGGFGVLLLLPLAWTGVLGDFVAALRLVAPGSGYNRTGLGEVVRRYLDQLGAARWWWFGAATLLVLGRGRPPADRRLGAVWVGALVLTSLYKPLSPQNFRYIATAFPVIGTGAVALAVAWVGELRVGPRARGLLLLGLVGLAVPTLAPEFVQVRSTLAVARAWLHPPAPAAIRPPALDPQRVPPGYRSGTTAIMAYYPWADYVALLDYLRRETTATTTVANLLKGDPAVVSMVGRVSALPAEATMWLRLVRPDDQAAFAQALEAATDAVVVWIPDEADPYPEFPDHIEQLTAVVRRQYRPAARFGRIEVWRRAGPVGPAPGSGSGSGSVVEPGARPSGLVP